MTSTTMESTTRHPVEVVAEDFLARYRRGERPSLQEYAERYPELATDLAELIQALLLLELHDSAALARLEAMPAPRHLGEFLLKREIGRGGMGVVYEAEQESLSRRVAVKVLPAAALLRPSAQERFEREARAAARLHHTNIVPVFGVGQADGVHYYAMQYIEGCGLDHVLASLRDEPAAPGDETLNLVRSTWPHQPRERHRQAARIVLQIAEALAHAHRQSVLHRDVKPGNILLEQNGTAWLSDFGLAQIGTDSGLTTTGDVAGTLRYLAPERLNGPATAQSDLYSLGLTLYELATLQPAFAEADRIRLLWDLAHREPLSPRLIDPELPSDLERVIQKAIARVPDDRYAGASEFADDLRRFLADRPVTARRPTAWERTRRWVGRNRSLTAALAVALAAFSLGLGATIWQWRIAEQERDQQIEAREQAEMRLGWLRDFTRHINEKLIDLPGTDPMRLQLLESITTNFESHRAAAHQDAELYHTLIRIYQRQAGLATQMGETKRAAAALGKAADLLADPQCPLAKVTRLQEQMTVIRERMALHAKLDLPIANLEQEFAHYAEQMRSLKSDDLHFLMSTALALRSTAVAQINRGEWTAAAETVRTCQRYAERWAARIADKDYSWKFALYSYQARCHNYAGMILQHQGRLDAAQAEYETALQMTRPLAGLRYGDEEQATILKEYLSLGPEQLGPDPWRAACETSRGLALKLIQNYPDVPHYYALASASATVHARGLLDLEDFAAVEQACVEGLTALAEAMARFGKDFDPEAGHTELERLRKVAAERKRNLPI